MARYLKENPWILYWTLCPASGHCRYVFKEFPLGNEYKVDFLILNSYSGLWEVIFVELESISDKLFTKKGTPTQVLAKSIKQIDDWKTYFSAEKNNLRKELCKWTMSKDILGYSTPSKNPSNDSANYLLDPNTYIKDRYYIVIGRSSRLSELENTEKAKYSFLHSMELLTYDRLYSLIKQRYPISKHFQ
ncbi:Shedu anti-phage system protein SduA domain-containing protein [Leptospira yanagawae]|uniref:Shedu anti-phage system protein SduA domain-containing protein n=1 Tax=Leptospira yanagawae TaxID=293069 RepID=UPI000A00F9F0